MPQETRHDDKLPHTSPDPQAIILLFSNNNPRGDCSDATGGFVLGEQGTGNVKC